MVKILRVTIYAMKRTCLPIAAFMIAAPAFADAPIPSRETGNGETVSAFMGLCVESEAEDYRERIDLVRESGWTVYYEEQAADNASEAPLSYEATASSRPGDTCSLHLTVEARENDELRCEVVVSQFCQRGADTSVRETVLESLSQDDDLQLDPVSTADENRRLRDHQHKVYRAGGGKGPLVRLADTGGTLYLSSTAILRNQ